MSERSFRLRLGAGTLLLAFMSACGTDGESTAGGGSGGLSAGGQGAGGTSVGLSGAAGRAAAGSTSAASGAAGSPSGDGGGSGGDAGAAGMDETGGSSAGGSSGAGGSIDLGGAGGHAGTGGTGGSAGHAGTGGAGGTGGSTGTPAPINVISTEPLLGATDNAPDIGIGAQLSANLNVATAGAAFTVSAGGTAIAGVASASGANLTFKPTKALEPNTTYTATISTGLASMSGGHLLAPFSWTFSTRRYAVATPIDLATDTNGEFPQIGIDPKGNAVVAWVQFDNGTYTVWANHFDGVASSWGTAKRLDSVAGSAGSRPSVAVDKNGNAFVVWSLPSASGFPNSIWAARYSATGATWSAASLLETDDSGETLSPLVAVDGTGNAIALWNQNSGAPGVYHLWSNRYAVGTGWGARAQVEAANLANGSEFDLGVDATGNALAVWSASNGAGLLLYGGRSAPGAAWGAPVVVNDGTLGVVIPHISVDPAGDAIATWAQPAAGNYRQWGARYQAGSGWQVGVAIQSAPLPSAGSSQIATDANGNAIALWTQNSPTVGGIWANANLRPGNTWRGDANIAWAFGNPSLAISPNGHAAIAAESSARIQANLGPVDATAGSGWGSGFGVQAQLMTATSPDIAVNDSGTGLVAWSQTDAAGHWRIWANRIR